MNMNVVRYVRIHRANTDSEATIRLPQPMRTMVAEMWIEAEYPGWQWEYMDSDNPDGQHAGFGYNCFPSVFG